MCETNGLEHLINHVAENVPEVFKPQIVQLPGGAQLLARHRDLITQDLNEFLERPLSFKQSIRLVDVDSFAAYYKRFATSDTIIVADVEKSIITASFDYGEDSSKPGWKRHHAMLILRKTPDYEKWCDAHGMRYSQEEFADFIQDMSHTVIEPTSASIIDMATNLRLQSSRSFTGKVNRSNGSMILSYTNDVKSGDGQQEASVPEKIHIAVYPYYASKVESVIVNLKVRLNQGSPFFIPELDQHWKFEYDAFNEVVKRVEEATGASALRMVG